MSSSEIAISVRGLGKAYTIRHNEPRHTMLAETIMHRLRHPFTRSTDRETFWALKDVSFDVKQGEVVGIIGRNGAGKSTLLKILSRITEPTTGEIDLYGRVGSLLEVGTGFHQELTGRENIYLNGAILGMTKAEIRKQFDAIVDFAGVEKFLDTPVKRYSSGMYVRLAFAVAAHLNPEILIVDEVLAVGDAEFQRKCLGKMQDVAGEGRTVLLVSHNMALLKHLCRTGIMLDHGTISAPGDMESCIARYTSCATETGEKIISHLQFLDPIVQVHSITCNDDDRDDQQFGHETQTLDIEIYGSLEESASIGLELILHDSLGNPLAFFSPAHERGTPERFPAGEFTIRHRIALPRLNKGHFVINMALTHPGYHTYAKIPSAMHVLYEGTPIGSGAVFECADGVGWLLLDELAKPAHLTADSAVLANVPEN